MAPKPPHSLKLRGPPYQIGADILHIPRVRRLLFSLDDSRPLSQAKGPAKVHDSEVGNDRILNLRFLRKFLRPVEIQGLFAKLTGDRSSNVEEGHGMANSGSWKAKEPKIRVDWDRAKRERVSQWVAGRSAMLFSFERSCLLRSAFEHFHCRRLLIQSTDSISSDASS